MHNIFNWNPFYSFKSNFNNPVPNPELIPQGCKKIMKNIYSGNHNWTNCTNHDQNIFDVCIALNENDYYVNFLKFTDEEKKKYDGDEFKLNHFSPLNYPKYVNDINLCSYGILLKYNYNNDLQFIGDNHETHFGKHTNISPTMIEIANKIKEFHDNNKKILIYCKYGNGKSIVAISTYIAQFHMNDVTNNNTTNNAIIEEKYYNKITKIQKNMSMGNKILEISEILF